MLAGTPYKGESMPSKEMEEGELGNQNDGLMVNQWKLLGIRRGPISKSDPGSKKVYWISFAIPVGLAALLETVGYRPYYLSRRLGEMRKDGQRPMGGEPRR
ncbi:unnamed protein product [Orchesella dallaii]|uniref:Uncharacterized protein n=1 Tax=Orchesella dallaii TaxID=48710 RepID=A0ABP1PZD1_9HEXA